MDVLLYSKFSPASKQLMLQLQQTPEIMESITMTCIDNKLIRSQILSDEKIKCKYLPCFIRLNEQSGNFDIYEGQNAFDFFSSLQSQYEQHLVPALAPPVRPPPEADSFQTPLARPPPEADSFQIPLARQQKKTVKQKAQQAESQRQQSEITDMKHKKEYIKNQGQDASRKAPLILKNKLSTSVKTVTFTPIEDLGLDNLQDVDDLEENDVDLEENDLKENDIDDIDENDIKQPTSISTYTHIPKNNNSEFSEREVRSKQAEMNASKNTGSLLSKAMKMQKERS